MSLVTSPENAFHEEIISAAAMGSVYVVPLIIIKRIPATTVSKLNSVLYHEHVVTKLNLKETVVPNLFTSRVLKRYFNLTS